MTEPRPDLDTFKIVLSFHARKAEDGASFWSLEAWGAVTDGVRVFTEDRTSSESLAESKARLLRALRTTHMTPGPALRAYIDKLFDEADR
jgi:hypothetical protein